MRASAHADRDSELSSGISALEGDVYGGLALAFSEGGSGRGGREGEGKRKSNEAGEGELHFGYGEGGDEMSGCLSLCEKESGG